MTTRTAKVFAGGMECETLTIHTEGSLMTVDGPYWFGEGLLLDNEYVGVAHYKTNHGDVASPMKPVFHKMNFCSLTNKFVGQAKFLSGSVDLEWRIDS